MSQLPSDKASEVNRERAATYGSATVNMEGFALMATFVFGVEVTAEQCAMYEVLKKCVREHHSGYKPDYTDTTVDICGWSNVLHMVKEDHRGAS